MNILKINNDEDASVKNEKWKNPGAKLYNELLDSTGEVPKPSSSDESITWKDLVKEAYLIAPVNKINNSPHGKTPYSRSGCKYPHHTIKDGQLVLNAGGVKAAYNRAKQFGIYKGKVKEHLDRHMKELGMLTKTGVHYESIIDDNFIDIESFITEHSQYDLSEDIEFLEKTHNKKYEFRLVIGENDGHLYKIVYDLIPENIVSDNIDTGRGRDELVKNIRKTGHNNYISKGNKIIGIYDMSAKRRVTEVSAYPPIHNSGGDIVPTTIDGYIDILSDFMDDEEQLKKKREELEKMYPSGIVPNMGFKNAIKKSKERGQNPIKYVVGEIDNTETYKTTDIKNVMQNMLGLHKESSIIDNELSWIESFTSDNEFRDSLFIEKSHGSLKYCYRIGFDAKTGKQVAVQFDLDPSAVTKFGDVNNIINAYNSRGHDIEIKHAKVIQNIKTNDAISDNLIRKSGHIDFISKDMKVSAIFYRNGGSLQEVHLIPIYSALFRSYATYYARCHKDRFALKDISEIDDMINEPDFCKGMVNYAYAHDVNGELYRVGEMGGNERYKTTKLLWGYSLLASYVFTPVLRGWNKQPGNGVNDIKKYTVTNTFKPMGEAIEDMIKIPEYRPGWVPGPGSYGNPDPYEEEILNRLEMFKEQGLIDHIDMDLIHKDEYDPETSYLDDIYYQQGNYVNPLEEKVIPNQYNSTNSSLFTEKSHGKLNYDFRLGWDYNTGHQIKVVYSLDNIDVTDVGDFYYNYGGKANGATHDSHLDYTRNNIVKKGNTDHQSKGQKILAITDMATTQKLNTVKLLAPFCPYINTRSIVQTGENLIKARQAADTNKDSNYVVQLTVGEIDNTPSYKSTHWASKVRDNITGEDLRFNKISKSEILKDGRGQKVDNINAKDFSVFGDDNKYMTYHNPNKKQALQELYMRERDIDNYLKQLISKGDPKNPNDIKSYNSEMHNLKIIQNDIDTIEHGKYDLSIMKKYRNYDEGVNSGLTGRQLLQYNTYMDFRPPTEINRSARRFGSVVFENGEFFFEADDNDAPPPMDDTEDGEGKDTKPEDQKVPSEDNATTAQVPEQQSAEQEAPAEEVPTEETPVEEPQPEENQQDAATEEQPAVEEPAAEEPPKEEKPKSLPKQTDAAETSKNGVRRKKLYIAFIEWCKEYNNHNTFGSIFDKDAFNVSYPFVPDPMRYFYRLANPMLCVLAGQLTFFPVAELRKLNAKNTQMNELLIFAATPKDLRVFNKKDNKVYRGTEENGTIKLNETLGETYDLYIQKMIGKGDILNAPLEEDSDTTS